MKVNLNDEYDVTKRILEVMRNSGKLITEDDNQKQDDDDTLKDIANSNTSFDDKINRLEDLISQIKGGEDEEIDITDTEVDDDNTSKPSQSEELEDDLLAAEEKAFMDSVSPKVEFNGFNIYRKERNVVFSGVFQDLNGLEWVMSLKDSDGLSISVETLKLDSDSIGVLNKLHGYYMNWSNEWALKLNTEYKYSGEKEE